MKRPVVFAIMMICGALLLAVAPAFGASAQQESRPVIAQPTTDAAVRGVVQIIGSATHPQFQRYELYYAPFPVPSDQSWIFIGDAHFSQQPLGLLGTWDSRSVPDGTYALRVRVVKADGNYLDSDAVRVLVANTRPVEPPTPEGTPEAVIELPPTSAPPTAAPVIAAPTVELPAAPEPTPTLEPEIGAVEPTATISIIGSTGSTTSGASGATGSSGDSSSITDQLFSSSRLIDTAKKAATYTAAAFLIVGAFFGIKALLVWLWYKIKP